MNCLGKGPENNFYLSKAFLVTEVDASSLLKGLSLAWKLTFPVEFLCLPTCFMFLLDYYNSTELWIQVLNIISFSHILSPSRVSPTACWHCYFLVSPNTIKQIKRKKLQRAPLQTTSSILPSSLHIALVTRAHPAPTDVKSSFITVFSLPQIALKWVGLYWQDSGRESANCFNPLPTLAKSRLWFAA